MLILESLGIVIDAEIAGPLYLAITTDTGCFRYSSTTARTHRMAAQLFDTGLPAGEIDDLVFSQKSRVRMQMESAALQSIEYFAQGKVAMVLILWNAIHEAGANEDDLENISALPRQVAGVDIGLTLRQEENGCKISVRTSPPYEANLICARLGGGGHARAGGCRLAERDLEAVRVMLLDSVYTCYPELGTI